MKGDENLKLQLTIILQSFRKLMCGHRTYVWCEHTYPVKHTFLYNK